MSTFGPQWTAPPAPDSPVRPLRLPWVAAGAGLAIAGHAVFALFTIVLVLLGPAPVEADSDPFARVWTPVVLVSLAAQLALFLGCVITGVRLLSGGNRGIGLGLLVGWVLGAAGSAALGLWVHAAVTAG